MRIRRASILLCLALIIVPIMASSQLKDMPLEALVRQSEVIVVGKVASLRSEWNSDRTRIYTVVTIAVEENLKGNQGQTSLSVTTLGGEVNGIGELYSHTAQFTQNERVVVFAKRDTQRRFRVSAGKEGKISLRENEVNGDLITNENIPLQRLKAEVKRATRQ